MPIFNIKTIGYWGGRKNISFDTHSYLFLGDLISAFLELLTNMGFDITALVFSLNRLWEHGI